MEIQKVAVEFGLSILLIVVIACLYFLVTDKDFAVSVFFLLLLLFTNCLSDVPLFLVVTNSNHKVPLSANFTPLYIWILWFIFIHDRYNYSEQGSLGPWIKSILLVSLLPISHIYAVKSNIFANWILFTTTCVIFVIPVYIHKLPIDGSVREIIISGLLLLIKTMIFLLAYVSSSIYNNELKQKNIVSVNNCLWILGSTNWLLPLAFLQIGTYFFIYSKTTNNTNTILPITSPNDEDTSANHLYPSEKLRGRSKKSLKKPSSHRPSVMESAESILSAMNWK